MADLLVDTDVFVDHLRGARALAAGGYRLHYSVVTRAELFAGAKGDEPNVALLLGSLPELSVDRPIAEQAGRIRRETGIRLPDALIAATALVHRLELMTRNVRDFQPVTSLRLHPSS